MARGSKFGDDPMVPVVGERVRAGLRWRGISNYEAAQRCQTSSQRIDQITAGESQKCRRALRARLARIIGPPVTVEYLGGERDLNVPALRWPPAPRGQDAESLTLPIGMLAEPVAPNRDLPPEWELSAVSAGKTLAACGVSDGENVARYLCDVMFWRELLFDGQGMGENRTALAESASAFATHMAAALAALLAPAASGNVKLRTHMAEHFGSVMNRAAAETMLLNMARSSGWESLLATADVAGLDSELRRHLERYRDKRKAEGGTEKEIAAEIRRSGWRNSD